ncbi:MAG TPA: twitching motility protein PilT [Balneola sp.]|jgi:rRNA-processing protein FCF1|nr:twitching motility protein PilT [Balneola sp.]MAO77013.1 twitching motility protein PilT [Balneola sp.]MBF64580.1 twitching motility protein PilT [Balneola sp.]MBF65832.1 twitching motility protein PilT [Balneola sp.]HAH52663.1 twitching motility protein PilT [Balneola sp.]|tara:strand:- start:4288 stop:5166 length:879 start_codon:yes stop_codon:yes gene_type:complete
MNDSLSYIARLEKQLQDLEPVIDIMMDNSSIYYYDINADNSGVFFIGANVYHWGDKDEKNQILAKTLYRKFYENFELLLENAHPNTLKKIEESDKEILNLIEQNDAPSSTDLGKSIFRNETKNFRDYLQLLTSEVKKNVIVPDTNSIIQFPNPISYRSIASSEKFNFVILPTVLSELDKLKTTHRNDDFRKKVKSVISRLKGYRNQGNVLVGVKVDKTITVKMIATEPNFNKTLGWIDSKNNDDRIIANVLELQLNHPSDNVILVTSDINLQNKAQLANLTVFDTDELEGKK